MCKQSHICNSCCDSVSRTTVILPQRICWYPGRHHSEEIRLLISSRLKVPAFPSRKILVFSVRVVTSAVGISLQGGMRPGVHVVR